MPWIECVPNVSEGRRPDVIEECGQRITRAGAALLDVTSDPAHHRSVYTFAGNAGSLHAAVLSVFECALGAIDLRQHVGVHPRVGAVDVVPFVPLAGSSMAQCVDLARTVGEDVARRYGVPVFLYEDASRPTHRRRLEEIRRGGLTALAERMRLGGWQPDFGPDRPHPSAGVTVIGARRPLIAFNVQLSTNQREIAKAIARAVRQSSGGLPAVKAIGVDLPDRGCVQVSMNLTDFRTTSVAAAFDAVRREASIRGVEIIDSELIGLAPAEALTPADAAHVGLRNFNEDRMILEKRLEMVFGRADRSSRPREAY